MIPKQSSSSDNLQFSGGQNQEKTPIFQFYWFFWKEFITPVPLNRKTLWVQNNPKGERRDKNTKKENKRNKPPLLLYVSFVSFGPKSREPKRIMWISCSVRGSESKPPTTTRTQRREEMEPHWLHCQRHAKTMGTGLISPPPPKLRSKQSQMSPSQKVEEENINLFQGKLRIACAWNTWYMTVAWCATSDSCCCIWSILLGPR